MLPRVFARVHPRTGAPVVSIVVLALAWGACLGFGFERLVTLDIMLYGLSLALEFAALVALRIKAPDLPRSFLIPGGIKGTVILAMPPMALLGFSLARSGREQVLGANALFFGAGILALGFLLYLCASQHCLHISPGSQTSSALSPEVLSKNE
jgi:amino acid transporter